MITISELDMFNNSYYDAYKGIYSLVAHEITILRSMYPEGAINDIDSYKACVLTKIMNASYPFMVVVEQAHDYASAATILRSIADNLASYILIYHERDENELLLRHYLFLYDGLKTRLKKRQAIVPDLNSPIVKPEQELLRKSVELATLNDNSAIELCLTNIRSNKLYKSYMTEIEFLINKKYDNWKYLSLIRYKESFSWANLYTKINGKESSSSFLSYLSQYVHGLSSSNLFYELLNPKTFEPLIGIGITFLGKINEIAQNDFCIKKEELLTGFFQSEYGIEHLSYMNPEFLERYFSLLKNKE